MVVVTLPDGSQRQFEKSISVLDVAQSIGAGLAKAALAGRVDQKLVDLSFMIEHDASVNIITEKDPEGLDIIRHSTAHLLAHAVKTLFPEAQVTIGPVIENGFYYDFAFYRPFTLDDLACIEAKMQELVQENIAVSRSLMSRTDAIAYFQKLGETFKVEIIESIASEENLSFYTQGDFTDLCRGPHVPSTGKLKVFKLTSVAGAYWRGDSNNQMLQRIYGTAFRTAKELEQYLHHLEEAEKRDHRKIAKALDFYHFQEEDPGVVFWHPDGWTIYQVLEQYMRGKMRKFGYNEVRTPQIVDLGLWKKSGHWDKFHEDMFSLKTDDKQFAIKPMSCPCHVQIFKQGLKSYRDLPLRFAEFGNCHRNEASGALHGLFRTRNFTQDDGHIFCTEEQIGSESEKFIDFLFEVYRDFGFDDVSVKLSTRPEKRVGSDEIWDKAEKALADVLNHKKLNWQMLPGEGAFYGPKIEFVLKDIIGRSWTTGSVQLDFSMPERLGAEYVAVEGLRKIPVMLHRAIFGSLERFLGILIEHYAGFMPSWLAPWQAVVLNITDRQIDYVHQLVQQLTEWGVRTKSDLRNEKVSYKIREHTLARIPYMLIVGDKELSNNTIAVRSRDGNDFGAMSLNEVRDIIQRDVEKLGRI